MKKLVILLLVLVHRIVFAQSGDIDSLKNLLKQELHDTVRLATLDKIIERTDDVHVIEEYSRQLSALSRKGMNSKGQYQNMYSHYYAIAQNNLAFVEENKGNPDKAEELYKNSLDLFNKIQDKEGQAMVLNNLGFFYKTKGKIVEAVDYYISCLQLREELNDVKGLAICQNNIGVIYLMTGDTPAALKYFHLALENNRKIKNLVGEFTSLNNLSGVYDALGEYDIYQSYLQQAYACAEKSSNTIAIARALDRMARAYRITKNYPAALENFNKALDVVKKNNIRNQEATILEGIAVTYEGMGQYDKALSYALESLTLQKKLDNRQAIGRASESVAAIYEKKGSLVKANAYFLDALNATKSVGDLRGMELSAAGLSRVNKKSGNYEKALEMHELYLLVKDSLRKDEIRKNALKAQYKFEFELRARQDSIKLVSDSIQSVQEKKILEAQLLEEKYNRKIGIYIGFLSLGVIGLFFYGYRSKQKIKELSLRNRIASDLHDEVGSAISSISMFASLARSKTGKEADTIVGEIESTSRATLDNMADIVWSIEPTHDDFSGALRRMEQFGNNITAASGIHFHFEAGKGIEYISLDMIQRKNIYLIFKEAINNAAKYSQAKNISVTMHKSGKGIVMRIADDGCGFHQDETMTGNGLRIMKQRAEEVNADLTIESTVQKGTIVKLSSR